MPRRPRVQFAGALYHVSNRGGHRRDIFGTPAAARAFEECLAEACARTGWVVHAYAIAGNEFQIALGTRRPNLVAGMHWLESTFCARYRRLHQERGHIFHGRYRAHVIEPGPSLCRAVNHVHLLPFREGAVPLDRLEDFKHCSFRFFVRRSRPAYLKCGRWLRDLGFSDNPAGWKGYRTLLAWLESEPEPDPISKRRRCARRAPHR